MGRLEGWSGRLREAFGLRGFDHPLPIVLVGSAVDPSHVGRAHRVRTTNSAGADENTGRLDRHERDRLHLADRLAEGNEPVTLQVDGLWRGAVRPLVAGEAVTQLDGEWDARVDVRHQQRVSTTDNDLLREQAEPQQLLESVRTGDGVDGGWVRVPHVFDSRHREADRVQGGLHRRSLRRRRVGLRRN